MAFPPYLDAQLSCISGIKPMLRTRQATVRVKEAHFDNEREMISVSWRVFSPFLTKIDPCCNKSEGDSPPATLYNDDIPGAFASSQPQSMAPLALTTEIHVFRASAESG